MANTFLAAQAATSATAFMTRDQLEIAKRNLAVCRPGVQTPVQLCHSDRCRSSPRDMADATTRCRGVSKDNNFLEPGEKISGYRPGQRPAHS